MECKLVLEFCESNWRCSCDSFDFMGEPNYSFGDTPEEALENFSKYVFDLEILTKRSRALNLGSYKMEVYRLKNLLEDLNSSEESKYLNIEALWDLKIEIEGYIERYENVIKLGNLGNIKFSIETTIGELKELVATIKQTRDNLKNNFIQEVGK